MRKQIVLTGIAVFTLQGCQMPGWSRPNTTEAQFNGDKIACEREAASVYPTTFVQQQAYGQQGYTTPQMTNCNVNGQWVNCSTTGGQYVPPATYTKDVNASNRTEYARNCLKSKGYIWGTREQVTSNYSTPTNNPMTINHSTPNNLYGGPTQNKDDIGNPIFVAESNGCQSPTIKNQDSSDGKKYEYTFSCADSSIKKITCEFYTGTGRKYCYY